MIPIDTMMPMTPARSMVVLNAWPIQATIDHSRAPVSGEARHHHEAEYPVVEDGVDHDRQQADEAGDEPRLQRRLAEGRRDTVWTVCWSSLTGRAP